MSIIGRLALATFLLPTLAAAQSTEADIQARLIGKQLYLRGQWADDKLAFDYDGRLKGNSHAVTFTLAGIDITSVKLKRDKLILEGQRVGLEFLNDQPVRVPLQVILSRAMPPDTERMHLEIDATPAADYATALDAIFTPDLKTMAPQLPAYWSEYAIRRWGLPAPAVQEPKAAKIGGSIKPPKLLYMFDPVYTPAARVLRHHGEVLVSLQVEADGTASHLQIARPLGLGLDEAALAAVSKYQFSPATRDGQPVAVQLNVDVNFQIFSNP